MTLRAIGKLLRGKATPFQLFSACVLGCVLGFMPGFGQAAGLIIALILVLIVLNANLALSALCLGLAKLLSLALVPVSFTVGRWLLDGPLSGLFQWLINAPVFALFGFEYYVVTGGLLLGLLLGGFAGWLIVKLMTLYRARMANLEKNSERYQKFAAKKWVKFLTFVLVGGGKGKVTYDDLLAKRIGNPIRPLGVVFAVLVVVLLVLVQMFASGPILTAAVQNELEQINGATVDLGQAELDLKGNRLTLEGLALADPQALDTDLFRAAKLEADISAASLLRKRLQLDRVVISDAEHGAPRAQPGRLVGPPPKPREHPKPAGDKTLEDYLKDYQVWKERLAQVKRWLEQLSGPAEQQPPAPGEQQETLDEQLERLARELGYAHVKATHLITGSPTFTISQLIAEGVRAAELPGETLSVTASNLSTHPALLGKAPHIQIHSSKGTLDFETTLGAFATAPTNNTVRFNYTGLPTEKVAGNLVVKDTHPIQGGTIDLAATGTLTSQAGVSIDLPLQATLRQVTITLPGGQQRPVDQMILPIGLSGPLDDPRIKIDTKAFGNALVKAGVNQALDEGKKKAAELLENKVGDKLGEQGKGLLKGLFSPRKK